MTLFKRPQQKVYGLLLTAALATASPLPAFAEEPHRFEISTSSATQAIHQFGTQSGVQILASAEQLEGKKLNEVAGTLSTDDGLRQLLAGTGITHRYVGDRTVALIVDEPTASARAEVENSSQEEEEEKGAQKKSFWDRFRVAQASSPSQGERRGEENQQAAPQVSLENSERQTIAEIIVTAQKRVSALQDTPISLTVLGREELERRSLLSAGDYLSSIPGVHFDSFGLGDNQLVIRGLGLSIAQSPTAGAYLGDVPLTDAIDFAMTDVKLVDMARVEILRGPQGTLYGSGALGGAVRQIPMAPALNTLEGKLKVGYATTEESNDGSYNAVGVINIPLLDDTLAFRAAGYHFKKAGVVDRIRTPSIDALSATFEVPVSLMQDDGTHEYSGVRTSTLFKLSEEFSATLMLGYQKLHQDGRSEVNMSARRYVDAVLDTTREFKEQEFKYANLLLDYDLGWASLTSSTSWTRTEKSEDFSHTRVIPSASNVPSVLGKKGVFQELRIATSFAGPAQFVAGGYYEDINRNDDVAVRGASPNIAALEAFWGTTDPEILRSFSHAEVKQLAFFGELTYEIADQLTLKAGTRWFDYERHDSSLSLLGVAPGVEPLSTGTGDLPTEEDGQVYKFGIDYRPHDNALIYAVWSQGFRLGRTIDETATYTAFRNVCDQNNDNVIDGTVFPFHPQVTLLSDSLDNLELGAKFTLLAGRLNISTAAYRIDWHDLPVTAQASVDGLGCTSTFNGGEARSQGIEFEAVLRATSNLQIDVSASLMDSEYLDDLADLRGERLPFSPKHNASIGLQYSFDLAGRRAFVRSDLAYVGKSGTSQTPPNVVFTDAYHKLGLRLGVAFQRFDFDIYGTNLTNEDALVGVLNLDRGWRMEPRVIGMEVQVNF